MKVLHRNFVISHATHVTWYYRHCVDQLTNIQSIDALYVLLVAKVPMGIVKIDDELHEEARRASVVMCRSINAQAEFWMKIGMLAEASPTLSFNDIVRAQFLAAHVKFVEAEAARYGENV